METQKRKQNEKEKAERRMKIVVYAICVGIYSLVFICIFHIIFARDNFRTILIRLRNMKGK
ncbi:hypothetical protein [[Ruminococcus] torques]|nr:hypothetical protein [[Ruminococcus] torques]